MSTFQILFLGMVSIYFSAESQNKKEGMFFLWPLQLVYSFWLAGLFFIGSDIILTKIFKLKKNEMQIRNIYLPIFYGL